MSRNLTRWYATKRISLGDAVVSYADLLKDADIRYTWVNGHGPIEPERQSIVFYPNPPSDTDFACDVPHCQKCIQGYKKDLLEPEAEVFV